MKIYDTPRAPNPRRVRLFLIEKGIEDVEIVPVSLLEGAHKQPDYLAKAGLANVPMLEMDDGTCITESLAICRYLESVYPEPNLMGRDPRETAIIEMWTRRVEMMVATPLMMAVRHSHPALAVLEQQNPVIADYNAQAGTRALKVLDRRLAESEWIAADRLTIADIVAFASIDFARMIKFKPPEEMTHVNRWLEAMKGRESVKIAL
ncbi:MAG: glutathione S-transferase [Phenylobacterium sp.]|uniref:glutathione S-transferase family protein n=1 Tax=Phenylobacterium sp. TaxID=1871053 RepID=UPI0027334EC6|nr:glutathione S-transferase [Phenylobacterium sp.]MDP1640776.1 glutathione S-transferase [Phenylobacterium sp.]MDP3117956.1 glutathione S-transferase [Phenylobacterium sp.]MDP3384128.1 glutathione S-transferase [Phenylobacterium sp.]